MMDGVTLSRAGEKTNKLGAQTSEILRRFFSEIVETNTDYVLVVDGNFDFSTYHGNDVDLLVYDIESAERILRRLGFAIKKEPLYGIKGFAFLDGELIVIDVISASVKGPLQAVGKACLSDAVFRSPSSVNTLSLSGMLLFKSVSVSCGLLHSEYQITRLRAWYDELSSSQRLIFEARLSAIVSVNFRDLLMSYLARDTELSSLMKTVTSARLRRLKKRVVFKGRLSRGVMYQPKLMIGFLRHLLGKRVDQYSLPNIAIVGNDGSGKTTLCDYIVAELYKLDPIHINMRGDESFFSAWNFFLPKLVGTVRTIRGVPALAPLAWVLAWMFEGVEFIDRRLRIAFGSALSDAGAGVVIFERYPTDRLRGELRPRRASLYPLDQFMPMPDLLYLIDVTEEESLKRKAADGHSLLEMTQKRENYKRLLQFVDRGVIVEANRSLPDNQHHLTETICRESVAKQARIFAPNRFRKADFLSAVSTIKTDAGEVKQKHGFF